MKIGWVRSPPLDKSWPWDSQMTDKKLQIILTTRLKCEQCTIKCYVTQWIVVGRNVFRVNNKQLKTILLTLYCVKTVQIRNFFWSVFSCIWTEYRDFRSISSYSVWIKENTDQKSIIKIPEELLRRLILCLYFFFEQVFDYRVSWQWCYKTGLKIRCYLVNTNLKTNTFLLCT